MLGEILTAWLAKPAGWAVESSAQVCRSLGIATLSFAEAVLQKVNSWELPDIRLLKEQLIEREKAATQKRIAQAVKAFNDADKVKKDSAIARIKAEAEAHKLEAEAEEHRASAYQKRTDADIKRAEAMQRVIESISRLRQEGGEIFFSKDNLEQVLSTLEVPGQLADKKRSARLRRLRDREVGSADQPPSPLA